MAGYYRVIIRLLGAVAALSFLVLGVRFAWLAKARSTGSASADPAIASPARTRSGLDFNRLLPPLPVGLQPGSNEAPVIDDELSLVFVDTSDPNQRPKVLLNGHEVGQSPYMGQLRCQPDETIEITFEYIDGSRVTKTVPCAPEVRVTD